MTRKQALMDLRDKVAAGELTRTSAEELAAAIFGLNQVALDFGGAYAQGSLDAALALHNAMLPGWSAHVWTMIDEDADVSVTRDGDGYIVNRCVDGNYPARAWLLAILSALIAECGE